ncbi:hypothetical protein PPL_08040 [Heterostelium album PN500]|uniref:Uncharacterized protein n=1 Tax=Heterostelium pallidum (strain ATCC 26659 / Pp 5 / PN500) TaxID=670386 RepID=D3BHN5_HETP5|nr:hypothetical protein PPL_08040 [Heterostelium album PN500]EFA79212.1 hypothetical protein PPL_08040 [Heterostelium album PN500]|eukprot:XP_020431333.1 hypothetical protein PPL_08040 [Heterostelium album PN500]
MPVLKKCLCETMPMISSDLLKTLADELSKPGNSSLVRGSIASA